ncbi:MAG: hypothetical protein M3M88_04380 [Thermoproteota archaeon]|nr:hypothetical protein [Thermoproteota archaeon]
MMLFGGVDEWGSQIPFTSFCSGENPTLTPNNCEEPILLLVKYRQIMMLIRRGM